MRKIMEDRTSVLIVLERKQVEKIDGIAGKGNRSAYIRGLIDITAEEQVKEETKTKAENQALKQTIAALKREAPTKGIIAASIMDKTFSEYLQWKVGMERNGNKISLDRELTWITMRARSINVKPIDFLGTLHNMVPV